MKANRLIGIWVAALWLSGCSVNTFLPANRFDFPETHGEWLWSRVQTKYQGTTRVEVFPSYADSPPVVDQPRLVHEQGIVESLAMSLEAGLSRRWDFFIKAPFAPAPALIGFKYQFLGHSFDKRQSGDFALSMTVAGGYARQDVDNTSTGGNSKLFQTAWAADSGIILGWRPVRDLMIYGGPFISRINTDGQITQSTLTYSFSGIGIQSGGHVGVAYSHPDFGLALEWAVVDFQWSYERRINRGYLGASFNKEF